MEGETKKSKGMRDVLIDRLEVISAMLTLEFHDMNLLSEDPPRRNLAMRESIAVCIDVIRRFEIE